MVSVHSAGMRAYIELELTDKNGKKVFFKRVRAHSYLKQWIDVCKALQSYTYAIGAAVSLTTVLDTGNVGRVIGQAGGSAARNAMPMMDIVNDSTYGMVVGTGTTLNNKNTVAMAAQIIHGVGAGQLSHAAQGIEDSTNPSGNDWVFRLIRTYTNNSAGSITVNELGMVVKVDDSIGTPRFFLIARDVLGVGVIVLVGLTLTVRYIQRITVA